MNNYQLLLQTKKRGSILLLSYDSCVEKLLQCCCLASACISNFSVFRIPASLSPPRLLLLASTSIPDVSLPQKPQHAAGGAGVQPT